MSIAELISIRIRYLLSNQANTNKSDMRNPFVADNIIPVTVYEYYVIILIRKIKSNQNKCKPIRCK